LLGGSGSVARFRNEKALSNAGYCSSSRGSLAGGAWIYAQHAKFGKTPDGARLDMTKRSPKHSGDAFRNLIPTPVLVDDRSFLSELVSYLLAK